MRLFEFGDMNWVPSWYHINMRRYLIFYYRLFGYFRLWVPATAEFIRRTGADAYLELGSGGGEVLGMVIAELPEEVKRGKKFILSDIKPVPEFVSRINSGSDSSLKYFTSPVDATKVPDKLDIPRIFINSFHHFTPEQVAEILKTSERAGQGVLVLEYVRHSPLGYLSMIAGALTILLTAPFVVNRRQLPVVLVFTYLLPIFPLMVLWDGIVSCLRVYDARALQAILDREEVAADLVSYAKRSLLYPAGVTAISIFPRSGIPGGAGGQHRESSQPA